jgi:hypothetical protein
MQRNPGDGLWSSERLLSAQFHKPAQRSCERHGKAVRGGRALTIDETPSPLPRQYARIVHGWIESADGEHGLRHAFAAPH